MQKIPIPIERLLIPLELNGSHGSNRAPADRIRQIAAENDMQAIETWLSEFHDSPQTVRHYRKEAERLLLWSLIERRKAFSSLTREDCLAYEDFLADPQPRELWCGPKAMRFSSDWRPFLGPLRVSSIRTALLVLNSLFSYLVKAGYLSGNPLALLKRRGRKGTPLQQNVERYLEHDQWQTLMETVETLPRESDRQQAHYERIRFLVALLYLLSPRVNEVASSTMGSFVEIRGRWWWQVVGKGAREARVPVNQDMIKALQRYRLFMGLSLMPEPGENKPLLMSIKGTSGITDNMIYRIIKDLVAQAADTLEAVDAYKATQLRRASTHWFRHTSITHQADAGIELNYLRRNARHAKLDTTGLYMHAEEAEWHEAMQRHRLASKKTKAPG
jgi:site-specific recombinase XerD